MGYPIFAVDDPASYGSKESSGKISALEYVADNVHREMRWQRLRCGGAPAIWATTLAEPPQAPDLDQIFNKIVNLNSQFSWQHKALSITRRTTPSAKELAVEGGERGVCRHRLISSQPISSDGSSLTRCRTSIQRGR